MSKQSKKKKKNKRPMPAQPTVKRGGSARRGESQIRLSQCMIVKNEERNIEKALSWGKGIVCEQIVVDTGSTDRTIEIAERLGAKVLQFEWVNDFAAAKNYAIEQASGNWIAFLDADEYFPKEEADKILPILKQVMENPGMRGKYAIACPMHQLDDNGKTTEVNVQARLFRNIPAVRYTGRIHEELSVGASEIIRTEDLTIMHTGYSGSANKQTGKSMRNIKILRSELDERPDDLRMKMYLADALVSHSNELLDTDGDTDVKPFLDEAEALYKAVVYGDTSAIDNEYKRTSYRYLLRLYKSMPQTDAEYEQIAENAHKEYPDDHKITCLYAATLNKKGEYQKAFDILRKLEARQSSAGSRSFAYSVPDLALMCRELITAAQGLGDKEGVLNYTTIMLTSDKANKAILNIYLRMLIKELPSYDNILEILSMIYDLNNANDTALIAAAARECGAGELAGLLEDR